MKSSIRNTLAGLGLLALAAVPAPVAAAPGDCTGYSRYSDCMGCCKRNYQSHPNCTNACAALKAFDAKEQQMSPKRNMSPKSRQ